MAAASAHLAFFCFFPSYAPFNRLHFSATIPLETLYFVVNAQIRESE
jgi:hypothetical protein